MPESTHKLLSLLKTEASLLVTGSTALAFHTVGENWLADLSNPLWLGFVLVWLLTLIVVSVFAVVRHGDALAHQLGEPYGTLILTLAVVSIEVMVIAAVMFAGEENPTLARDTIYGGIMIVLNGVVGSTLLIGGWLHREQEYNLSGANAFLSVITSLAIIGLILPFYTLATQGPTFSTTQKFFMMVICLGLYGVLLAVQTVRHRHFFIDPVPSEGVEGVQEGVQLGSIPMHAILLIAHLIPVVMMAEEMGIPLNHSIEIVGAPAALGGFFIALVILLPEAVAAMRAALANQIQRAINITLGSAAATIGLTIPAVLGVSLVLGHEIALGLNAIDQVMLILTLLLTMNTFGSGRTNILQGAVHLVIFVAYIVIIFD